MAKNSIDSILTRTFYPNYELIIVDNNSDKETVEMLESYRNIPEVKLILNKENYGFAKGNNIGLKAATGEYLVLINNDILVTPGWLSRLLFYIQKPKVALAGPVTNSIGNEAKINISYNPFEIKELETKSLQYTSSHWGNSLSLNCIAAFCWIMTKDIYKKLGGLDERYGRGLFEDDDYCFNVKKHGYQILCTEDSFVHHFGGMSFKKIQTREYQQLFDDNKNKFETKWNTKWVPHKYRK
jgi:GT2 family glycosyltransferase